MKAILCTAFGPLENLKVADIEPIAPGPGEVRIDVVACGVNFPDVLIVEGKYQFKPDFPFSPGGEVAGVVAELGPDVDGIAVGARVVVLSVFGGFSESLTVPRAALIAIPAEMPFTDAAALFLTYGTTYHALVQRAALKRGENLLVLGAAGGVGLAAVHLGKVMGARVIAAASTPEKRALARAHGADEVIDYTTESLRDRTKELTDDQGADVIYDPVGGALMDQVMRAVAWQGRVLIVGFASGDIPRIPANLILLKGCQVVGVFWGDFRRREPALHVENCRQLIAWYVEGKIRPFISKQLPLEAAQQALEAVRDRQVQGKIILVTEAGRKYLPPDGPLT